MNQLTIRGVDADIERRLHEIARQQGISLNKAAIYLLRKGADMVPDRPEHDIVGDSLDEFIGVWSAEEEKEFLESIKACEQIDESFWR